jgi:hypothetical protein
VAPKEIDLPTVPTGFGENPLDLREAAKDAEDNSSVERKEFWCTEDVEAMVENFSKTAAGDETSGGENFHRRHQYQLTESPKLSAPDVMSETLFNG